MAIHRTAVVDPKAEVGANVEIGPYCVVGQGVVVGPGCRLHHHVSLSGPLITGEENEFYPFCAIGGRTQDLKYVQEPTHLEIGARNVFREFVTINRGTGSGETTVIGSDNTFLAYAHVAHNCTVGNDIIFSNNATLAGHVTVEDFAVIGGLAAAHQFCRIGRYAMIGGCSKVVQDVPPYLVVDGNPAVVRGVNTIGLQRRGWSEEQIAEVRQAYKILYNKKLNTTQALEQLQSDMSPSPMLESWLSFIKQSSRGIIR